MEKGKASPLPVPHDDGNGRVRAVLGLGAKALARQ
jgi:hypothetical protein